MVDITTFSKQTHSKLCGTNEIFWGYQQALKGDPPKAITYHLRYLFPCQIFPWFNFYIAMVKYETLKLTYLRNILVGGRRPEAAPCYHNLKVGEPPQRVVDPQGTPTYDSNTASLPTSSSPSVC